MGVLGGWRDFVFPLVIIRYGSLHVFVDFRRGKLKWAKSWVLYMYSSVAYI